MSDSRTSASRFRLGAVLTVVILLAMGSFWLLDVMRRSNNDVGPQVQRTEPDYFVEGFTFVRTAKTGETRYHISGARMVHNPVDDSYEIEQPVVKTVSNDQPPITITAKRALADGNASQVQLFDQVEMQRPASATSEAMRMRSDFMLVLPDEDVMKTDRPVEINFGQNRLNGVGMFANQATREFKLLNQVRAFFPPRITR